MPPSHSPDDCSGNGSGAAPVRSSPPAKAAASTVSRFLRRSASFSFDSLLNTIGAGGGEGGVRGEGTCASNRSRGFSITAMLPQSLPLPSSSSPPRPHTQPHHHTRTRTMSFAQIAPGFNAAISLPPVTASSIRSNATVKPSHQDAPHSSGASATETFPWWHKPRCGYGSISSHSSSSSKTRREGPFLYKRGGRRHHALPVSECPYPVACDREALDLYVLIDLFFGVMILVLD